MYFRCFRIFLCAAHKNPKECSAIDYTRYVQTNFELLRMVCKCAIKAHTRFGSRYFELRIN